MSRVPLDDTIELRDRVLSPGHPGRPVVWPYDDDLATHWGAFADDRLVGCVSHCPGAMPDLPSPKAHRFHSMAVDVPWQRQGVGRLMLRHLASRLHEAGADMLFATARESAVGFYLRCGMRPAGPFVVSETNFEVRYVTLDRAGMARLIGVD